MDHLYFSIVKTFLYSLREDLTLQASTPSAFLEKTRDDNKATYCYSVRHKTKTEECPCPFQGASHYLTNIYDLKLKRSWNDGVDWILDYLYIKQDIYQKEK